MTQQRVSPVVIRSLMPATVTHLVQGAIGQSVDIAQWQNSSGTVLAEINASGGFELNGKDIELMTIMGAL